MGLKLTILQSEYTADVSIDFPIPILVLHDPILSWFTRSHLKSRETSDGANIHKALCPLELELVHRTFDMMNFVKQDEVVGGKKNA